MPCIREEGAHIHSNSDAAIYIYRREEECAIKKCSGNSTYILYISIYIYTRHATRGRVSEKNAGESRMRVADREREGTRVHAWN